MAVACGYAHTLALAERGCQVFACGYGGAGQRGAGTREHQRTPAPVAGLEGLPDVVMVAAGYEHSAAITSAGRLLLWGTNQFGQLGQGDREDRLVPVTLGPPQFGGAAVAMVAADMTAAHRAAAWTARPKVAAAVIWMMKFRSKGTDQGRVQRALKTKPASQNAR